MQLPDHRLQPPACTRNKLMRRSSVQPSKARDFQAAAWERVSLGAELTGVGSLAARRTGDVLTATIPRAGSELLINRRQPSSADVRRAPDSAGLGLSINQDNVATHNGGGLPSESNCR